MPACSNTNGDHRHHVRHAWPDNVGILSMDIYFPRCYVDQTELEEYDGVSKGKYTIGLGQTRMGFCTDREDIHSLCLTVTKRLLEKSCISPKDVGFLMVGTETLVDKSKSVKTVLMQLFEDSGNSDIEGLDTTNACYGGTSALFHACNWIESSSWDGRYAVVVAADIAIYAQGPARPTGGAGAIAMLIGPNAPLVFDRNVRSTHMAHVYDFYKPDLLSEYPVVEGKSTIVCFTQALDICYSNFCRKYEKIMFGERETRTLSLNDFDGLIFHSPYCKLVQKSVARLMLNEFLRDPKPDFEVKYTGLEEFRKFSREETIFNKEIEKAFVDLSSDLFKEKTKPSLMLATEIGNMYTASLYSCLVSHLLSKSLDQLGGQKLMLFSYGSGMAASIFSISVTKDTSSGSPLDRLYQGIKDVTEKLSNRIKVTPKEFDETLKHREETHHVAPYNPIGRTDNMFHDTYYLVSIDSMYRRKYEQMQAKNDQNITVSSGIKVTETRRTNGQRITTEA